MKAILENISYEEATDKLTRQYKDVGYGPGFYSWIQLSVKRPYFSCGNGAAMRISPIAYAFKTEEEVLIESEKSVSFTHNHPEGIKGGQAIAMATFLALNGKTKEDIKEYIESRFNYDLSRKIANFKPFYAFDASCMGSVPEAIICFLEASSYEGTIRNAIALGGDADTLACMAGGIAEAFYKDIPVHLEQRLDLLTDDLREIVEHFYEKYNNGTN
jgi:ADP-ribosylglycohydrolase